MHEASLSQEGSKHLENQWPIDATKKIRMVCYSVKTQAYSEKEIPSSPNRSRTYNLPITSSDALPLSHRRLVGAKAIKLGSWDKHPAHC